jgi:hypothetical protein
LDRRVKGEKEKEKKEREKETDLLWWYNFFNL